jgi:predicted metal-dependent hydrolase
MISLLSSLRSLREPPKLEPKIIDINGEPVTLAFKRNARCKRMVLRLTSDGSGVAITLPQRASLAEALRFAENSKPWISKTMSGRAAVVAFGEGNVISYLGVPHKIHAPGGKRGVVSCENSTIIVPGDHAHVPRRLRDWLKVQAQRELLKASQNYATAMGVKYRKLTLRDQTTRWGSCSSGGDLSYSWRLILAPMHVLDYVAAHEVAHLKEMNHGPRFWRLVITHCKNAKESRRWLRLYGRELHRYGASKP